MSCAVKGGIPFKSVNLGGKCFKDGNTLISQVVAVNAEDVKAIKELLDMGIEVEIRKLWNEPKGDVMAARIMWTADGRARRYAHRRHDGRDGADDQDSPVVGYALSGGGIGGVHVFDDGSFCLIARKMILCYNVCIAYGGEVTG